VVGSDIPGLSEETLVAAIKALDTHEVRKQKHNKAQFALEGVQQYRISSWQ
jgi:hypothetical protein